MAKYQVTAPDGGVYEITAPDNMSEQDALARFQQEYQQQPSPQQPNNQPNTFSELSSFMDDMAANPNRQRSSSEELRAQHRNYMLDRTNRFSDTFMAGIGKGLTDIGRGVEQAVRHVAPGVSPEETALDEEITEAKQLDQPLMDSKAGFAGNLSANVAATAPAMLVPGVNTYVGAGLLGAGIGATQPVAEGESRSTKSMLGAAGAMGGRALVGGVSRLLAPKTAPAVTELLDDGVPLTPGQVLGGAARRAEEGMTSVPLVGDAIKAAEVRAMSGFNKSVLDDVLKPIGETADGVGREGLKSAAKKVSDRYQQLLPSLTSKADDVFIADVRRVGQMAQHLQEPVRKQFEHIVRTQVLSKFSPNGAIPGEAMKQVDSELGRLVRGYKADPSFDSKQLGAALDEIKTSLRAMVGRANPQHAAQLKEIDTSFARLLRAERAGGAAGAVEGVFTPAQLKAATKAMDSSLRKKAFTQGDALLQSKAEGAQGVLGSKVPDSGTPFRMANMIGATGALAAGSVSPAIPLAYGAAGLGAAGAYSQPGAKALAAILARRPDLARSIGDLVGRGSGLGAILGSNLTNKNRQGP